MACTCARAAQAVCRPLASSSRSLSTSARRHKVTQFLMPSMSPTMEQGTIGQWKVKEGDKFSTGDVLLTIETDKAEIDVEAQDDGILGRIVQKDGSAEIKIGDVIALLSEEGDSASDLDAAMSSDSKEEAPAKDSRKAPEPQKPAEMDKGGSTSSTPQAKNTPADHEVPKQYRGLLPSVLQLCLANGIEDPSSIKSTGLKGLTKGDVLAHLGKVASPGGSLPAEVAQGWTTLVDFKSAKAAGKEPEKAKTGPVTPVDIRRAIMSGLTQPMRPNRDIEPLAAPDFDSVLRDYLHAPRIPKDVPSRSTAASLAHSLPRGDSLRAVLEA